MDYSQFVRGGSILDCYPGLRISEIESQYRLLAGVRMGGPRILPRSSLEEPKDGKEYKNE